MATIHDRLVAALQKRGAKPSTAVRTSKYTVLAHDKREGHFWFIGKAGALRTGSTIANSVSTPAFRESLLRLEDRARTTKD